MKNVSFFLLLFLLTSCCSNDSQVNNNLIIDDNAQINLDKIIVEIQYAHSIKSSRIIYGITDKSIFIWNYNFLSGYNYTYKYEPIDEYMKISNAEVVDVYRLIEQKFTNEDFSCQKEDYDDGFYIDLIFLYNDEKVKRFQLENSFTENQNSLILLIITQIIENTDNEENNMYFEKLRSNFVQ
jgi:hypothetical protein